MSISGELRPGRRDVILSPRGSIPPFRSRQTRRRRRLAEGPNGIGPRAPTAVPALRGYRQTQPLFAVARLAAYGLRGRSVSTLLAVSFIQLKSATN